MCKGNVMIYYILSPRIEKGTISKETPGLSTVARALPPRWNARRGLVAGDVIPREIRVVAEFPRTCQHIPVPLDTRLGNGGRANAPWLEEVRDGEDGAEHDAQAADDHVRDTEEGVPAAHHGAGGDDEGLCALVYVGGELCAELLLLASQKPPTEVWIGIGTYHR